MRFFNEKTVYFTLNLFNFASFKVKIFKFPNFNEKMMN